MAQIEGGLYSVMVGTGLLMTMMLLLSLYVFVKIILFVLSIRSKLITTVQHTKFTRFAPKIHFGSQPHSNMTPFIILLVITLVNSEGTDNSTKCDNFQANFNLKDVTGAWHVVAIIPEKLFPEKQVTCYKVEISETDGGSLRWLINNTVTSPKKLLPKDTDGIIVRQRYHTEDPFDVWSKSIRGVNGCFQQVISLDIGKNDIHKALKHDAMMQLHLLEIKGSQPFLMQMLWGRMITVVIYRRKQGVTQDELKPVFELINKLRGPQRLPKLCDSALRDILVF